MFTSKKYIDRLHDSITELHTDKERYQRIIHNQSDTILGLTVGIRQQAKVIQSLSEENRQLKGQCYPVKSIECRISLSWNDTIESALKEFQDGFMAVKSEPLRDEKGRFKKRK